MKKRMKKIVILFIAVVFALSICPAAVSGETVDTSHVDPKNWMAALPDGLAINQINIPGTHDSGTCHVWGGVCGYVSTQSYQIDDQLEHGIRCFDIRVAIPTGLYSKKTYHDLALYHGYCVCTKYFTHLPILELDDVLSYCNSFLKKHPKETIIFKFQREHGDDATDVLKDMQKEFDGSKKGHYRYYKNGDEIPSLGDVRGCIVMIDNSSSSGGTHTKYEDHYEAPTKEKIQYVKDAFDYSGEQNFLAGKETFKNEWKLENEEGKRGEPAVKCVFTSANAFSPLGLKADFIGTVADSMYSKLLKDYAFEKGKRYGWIFMDFPEQDIINKIIATNLPPTRDLKYEVVCENGAIKATDLEFFIKEKNSNELLKTDNLSRNYKRILVTGVPVFSKEYKCDYSIVITNLPKGYYYDVVPNGDQLYNYKIIIKNPEATHVKINWSLCPDHPYPPSVTFKAYEESTETPGKTVNKTVYGTEYIDDRNTVKQSFADLIIANPSFNTENHVVVDRLNDRGFCYNPYKDVKRIDDHNHEITLHAEGPYAEINGEIRFNDDSETKSRRPAEEVFNGIRIVGRIGSTVVADGPVDLNFSRYEREGIVSWRVEDAPLTFDSLKLTWSAEYPEFNGYTRTVDGYKMVLTPVPLLNLKGQLTFDDDNDSASLRPSKDDLVFKELFLKGTTKDSQYTGGFDVNYDFSKYDSDGIITWKAEGMPVKSPDGDDLTWSLNVPEFAGYDAQVDGYNVKLTLTKSDQKLKGNRKVSLLNQGAGSEQVKHYIRVENGQADAVRMHKGGTIFLTADEADNGKEFDKWIAVSGDVVFEDEEDPFSAFVMPDEDVEIKATYKEIEKTLYGVTVTDGLADAKQSVTGNKVTLTAEKALVGQKFEKWKVLHGDVKLKNSSSEVTTFTMPEGEVAVEAVYKIIRSKPGNYKITEGKGQTYYLNSGKTLEFKCNGEFERLYTILIDGEEDSPKHFDCRKGSTIAAIKNSYLEKLKPGKHTIQFRYGDGESDKAEFTVAGSNAANGSYANVQTGDSSSLFLWIGIMAVSAMLAGLIIRMRGKAE